MKEKNVKIKFNTFIGLVILLGILMTQGVFAIPTWIGNPWDTTINGFEDNNPSVAFNISEYITSSIEEIPLRFVFGDPQNISSTLYGAQVPSFYHWISLDSSTGIFTINATSDNQTGEFNVSLDVYFSTFSAGARPFTFNVSPVNDAPQFSSIENKSFNSSELFSYTVYVTDEENNIPFVMNISFLNCSVAEWSTRNCSKSSDMILFNTSNYNFDSTSGVLNLGFTPLKNDVGNYIINFSVMDNSSLGNKTTSQIVNFTVLNVNSAPYFRYVCDNERNSIENQEVACWINVSDVDELYNITFSSNYPWFTFYNGSVLNNTLVAPCNVSTSFNSSALVNFTSTDYQVGNWSVNITLMDTGGTFPPKGNSTIFWFFINNTEDNVSLAAISNDIVYENVTIYVDAIDNDLLVPDKSVKNEILTFASNTSWVSISSYSISGNITRAEIKINYDLAVLMGVIDAIVSVNVSDTGGNTATRNFTLTIDQDNAAVWNVSMANSFLIYENSEVYLNFTQNVSDADLDPITFSFTNSSAFPSFNINSSTGIINFTPIDGDVGYHSIIINAYDGKKDSFKSFNFTILNVNDNSSIETPLQVNANATVNITNSNIQGSEDSRVIITVWVMDDDFKIPSNQKSFYNESLNVSVSIQGVNSSLFRFSKTASFPTTFFPNRTEYIAAFTPGKADVGIYNITLNVTDSSNYSTVLRFNLTISSVNHPPVLANLTNQTSAINKNLYYRINASDIEDGDSASIGNNNFNFSYSFISGTNILNSTTFNGTSGEINITFNSSQGGRYHLNITVNDSGGLVDRGDFWIYVYDTPSVIFPSQNHQFNLTENVAANLTFRANHSLGDNLN
ncbi:MAG: hypothetical protein WCP89_03470, partial [archaeon]